ncbi:MAG: hypothetical protein JSU64_05850, partial [candidate division WOR-3 bacterium]
EAVKKLEEVARMPDSPPRTQYYLGHAYLRSGKNEEARAAFESFLETWQGDRQLILEVRKLLNSLSP